jgi:hypothetical protein
MPVPIAGTIVEFFDIVPQSGNTLETRELDVAASQTIRRGYPIVKTSAANTYEVALANPSASSTTAQSGDLEIVGWAAESITTNASGVDPDQSNKSKIRVYVYNPSTKVALPIYNATAANAEPRDLTIGTAYEIVRVRNATQALGGFFLSTVTTDGDNRYVQTYAGSGSTDDYGIVWVIKDSLGV